ncbi:major facilitator superfamily domain-containing protein [Cladorrhinum samala]|uniref:Major facilitator superfamily domain-containing protein n=1 Tax=Cladorrhinum samala TaxID=585594 RepID=A0AAV9HYY9_9PEZI|nr:major facilitator superfamily domain-containing protein [Cladorrhinum samala]
MDEAQPSSPSSENPNHSSLTEKTPITSLYLTFSTPLPSLPYRPPIPPPDLARYSNPLAWPSHVKTLILLLSCTATFLTGYSAGSYSPPQQLIRHSLSPVPGTEAVLAGITTFCFGFALAPMMLAPLSEMNGRYPVFVVSGVIYVAMQAVCGVVKTVAQMLVARFFVGVGASVFSTMVGGVIADMYDKEARNTPMAIFSGFVLAGTGLGPLVGSVMAQRLGGRDDDAWKWVWWHQVLAGGVLMIALVLLFRESRGSVLLSRKAKTLNKWYESLERQGFYGVLVEEEAETGESGNESESTRVEVGGADDDEEKKSVSRGGYAAAPAASNNLTLKRIRWVVEEDEQRDSLHKMITVSISRPFHLLFTEPVVFFFSLWVAFAWGVLYLTFGSIPLVFQDVYDWNLEQAGYVFSALIVGAVLATLIALLQEKLLRHPKWTVPLDAIECADSAALTTTAAPPAARLDPIFAILRRRFPTSSPESRLYFTCISSTLLPIGLYIFGLTARPHIHFIVPSLGLMLATMGILSIYLAVFNYFADVYTKYASSALAAQSFCRNVLGGAFPLVTGPLFRNLGQARAGALLGSIALLLTVVPWVLVFFGERIRGRSSFAIVSVAPLELTQRLPRFISSAIFLLT